MLWCGVVFVGKSVVDGWLAHTIVHWGPWVVSGFLGTVWFSKMLLCRLFER